MAASALLDVYQFRIRLSGVSPLIWRRLLLRSDTSIADLHHLIQAAFDWSDSHLRSFVIHGKDYGSVYAGGMWFNDNPKLVRLADFGFRINERFFYEYDFYDLWRHEIRLEQIVPFDPMQRYPHCMGGGRAAPPEDCGGPQAFLTLRQHFSIFHITERLLRLVEQPEAVYDPEAEEVLPMETNHTTVYRQLQQVAERLEAELGDEQACFVEGCQRDWNVLPHPQGPCTVGIDGGYVHARDGDREQGWLVRGDCW